MKNPVLIFALAISAAAMALGLWSWQQWAKTTASHGQAQWSAATVLPQSREVPDVNMTDQDGAPFSFRQLEGNWSLLFFGFTHCPDICPNTLALLKAVNDSLISEQHRPLQMVFVSVDPARDTASKLRDYVHYFDPTMLGVTGAAAELQRLTAGLYLPFQISQPDENGHYDVDHSASLVLLNPDNRVKAYFSAPHQLDLLLADLRRLTEK